MLVSQIKEIGKRKYIEHNGKPYLMYGMQLRIDDAIRSGHSVKAAEEYFKISAENNFKTVVILISWREIEPFMPTGKCENIENMTALAEKYDITLQWCWFGSNVCGAQHSVPDEVWNDPEKYPVYLYKNEKVLDCTAAEFINREDEAFKFFLKMLAEYDTSGRTAVIQIENEPDFGDWRNQRTERIQTLNRLGLLVKKGPYRAVTRVNITAPGRYLTTDNLIEELLNQEGIDIVGADVYYNMVSYYDGFIDKMSEFSKNIPHFAEVGAHIDNLPLIICNSFVKGTGCLLYELRTTLKRDFDFGLYRMSKNEWIERDGTQSVQHQWTVGDNVPEVKTSQIRALNNAINILGELITLTPVSNMALHKNCQTICFNTFCVEPMVKGGVNDFFMTIRGIDGNLYFLTPSDEAEFKVVGDAKVEKNSGLGWTELKASQDGNYIALNGTAYRVIPRLDM